MHVLNILHVDSDRFKLQRTSSETGLQTAEESVQISSPYSIPDKGKIGESLIHGLQWYLERFLDYPFSPDTEVANRIWGGLQEWGQLAFQALFGSALGAIWFQEALEEAAGVAYFQVSSSNPMVLSWPWEAVNDPDKGFIGHLGRIDRRLNKDTRVVPLPNGLPRNRINILLVTPRPYKKDIQYRAVSLSLVEMVKEKRLPASFHVLRPPSFKQLRRHLAQHKGFYHIFHFDGHGTYGDAVQAGNAYTYGAGPMGHLLFEKEDTRPDPIPADRLAELFREHYIPIVVLNACQSAMISENATNPFSSVATALLKAGVRSVVAMAYSLYVSGAQEFLPSFYQKLFEKGEITEATRAGRSQMFAQPMRVCRRGQYPLQDWLIPVVYQQSLYNLSFVTRASEPEREDRSQLPPDVAQGDRYGFIGRDSLLLELERGTRKSAPAILIHGLGGVGKTSLARGFVKWLADTKGLGAGCIWIRFTDEMKNAEFIFNLLGDGLGDQFLNQPIETKLVRLTQFFHKNPFLIVWDNFEVVAGIENKSLTAAMPKAQRDLLKKFIHGLRGGKTKALITSRGREQWLGRNERIPIHIGGLQGEERWAFARELIYQQSIHVDMNDEAVSELIDRLDGHPLAMQIILPLLENYDAPQILLNHFNDLLSQLDDEQDEETNRFLITLGMVEQHLDDELRFLLVPLAFHERFVGVDFFPAIAKSAELKLAEGLVQRFFDTLEKMGVLHLCIAKIRYYELHPALSTYLRTTFLPKIDQQLVDAWAKGFILQMEGLAAALSPTAPLNIQRRVFHSHGANFQMALEQAKLYGLHQCQQTLIQAMMFFALASRDLDKAEMLSQQLIEIGKSLEDIEGQGIGYHQLGIIAQERGDYKSAEKWYRRSKEISEKLGNEADLAKSYEQLGIITALRCDYKGAQEWNMKAVEIRERDGLESDLAISYHNMGIYTQELGDYKNAKKWYMKAVEIRERLDQMGDVALTYHQLGILAHKENDSENAEKWCRRAMETHKRLGNETSLALGCHQMGKIHQKRGNYASAEKWYRQSMEISEKLGSEIPAADAYHQLGIIAQERGDYKSAEKWYMKAVEIRERLEQMGDVAGSYHQLGMLAQLQNDSENAEKWYRQRTEIEERYSNDAYKAHSYHKKGISAQERGDYKSAEKWYMKAVEIRERDGLESDAASSYFRLGVGARLLCDFESAEKWFRKGVEIEEGHGNEYAAALNYVQMGFMWRQQKEYVAAGRMLLEAIIRMIRAKDWNMIRIICVDFFHIFDIAGEEVQLELRIIWGQYEFGSFYEIQTEILKTIENSVSQQKGKIMDALIERINAMSESEACRLLGEIADFVNRDRSLVTDWGVVQKSALKEAFGIRSATLKTNQEEIAKEALKIALINDDILWRIERMIEDSRCNSYDLAALSITIAALIILQTKIEFKWDSGGKKKLTVIKKAADDNILKPLVERLLSYIPKGPFGA